MKRITLIATAMLLPAGVTLAQGQPQAQPQSEMPGTPSAPVPPRPAAAPESAEVDRERGANANFQMLDSNADGRISRVEAAADDKLGSRFAQIDRNEDGYVDSREYRRHASGQ